MYLYLIVFLGVTNRMFLISFNYGLLKAYGRVLDLHTHRHTHTYVSLDSCYFISYNNIDSFQFSSLNNSYANNFICKPENVYSNSLAT